MILTDYFSPSIIVLCAGGVQVIGYLVINQVLLRLILLVSTALYILYYYTVGPLPLWEPIGLSFLTMIAILLGLGGLYLRNAKWALPARDRDIAPLFEPLQPGDLRLLMRGTKRYKVPAESIVTRTGARPESVYFVVSGEFTVTKADTTFTMYGPTFVGEVAYLSDAPSVATTILPAGVEVIEWSMSELAHQSRRKPRFRLALEAAMSHDLVRKVRLAVAPSEFIQAPREQTQTR